MILRRAGPASTFADFALVARQLNPDLLAIKIGVK
jgi:hypothetical protein